MTDPYDIAARNARKMMEQIQPLLWRLVFLRELEAVDFMKPGHVAIRDTRIELFEVLSVGKSLKNT